MLALVLSSYLKIEFQYTREQDDDTISLEFFLWGFINYKIEMPVLILQHKLSGLSITTRTELETGGEQSREIMGKPSKFSIESLQEAICKFELWWPLIKDLKADLERLLAHTRINNFQWRIAIGTKDAAATGLITGITWSLMGGVMTLLAPKFGIWKKKPELQVDPDFRKEGFSTSLNCIFKIRLGYIMVTGIKILKKMVKRRGVKGIVRTSHRRTHENCHGEY